MTPSPEIARLHDRRKAVAEEISARGREIEMHNAAIAALRSEDRELEIASRVFQRFSDDIGPANNDVSPMAQETATATPHLPMAASDTGKPPNTPPVTEMIVEALRFAKSQGRHEQQPADMVPHVRNRWWPNMPAVSLGPIAWRMWKRGELVKGDGGYSLPENGEPIEAGPDLSEARDLLASASISSPNGEARGVWRPPVSA